MSEQPWMDTSAGQGVGVVFRSGARAVEVAAGAVADCSFGSHAGTRYAAHGENYAAGLLAVVSSVDRFVESSRSIAGGLFDAAATLTGEDVVNAATFGAATTGDGGLHG